MMRQIIVLPIRFYKKCISPLFPPCCRYTPTCSQYALTAILRFGAVKGLILAVSRILRCHPFAEGGADEVPETFSWRRIHTYFWQKRRR